MISADDLKAALVARVAAEGITMSSDAITMAIADVDLPTVRAELAQKYTWWVWDRSSPVGDVSAADVLARPDVVGEAYIVAVNGKPLVFQTHKPGVGGLVPMTIVEAAQFANRQVETLVDHEVLKSVLDGVLQRWKRSTLQTSISGASTLTSLFQQRRI
jgi:hypothetical protein